MSRSVVEHFIRRAIDWFFRVSAVERWLITSAFGVMVTVFAGPPLVGVVLGLIFESVPDEYLAAVRVVDDVDLWILLICSILILAALGIVGWRLFVEYRSSARKRVIVVEGRGLRDDDGSPLVDAIPKSIPGQRISLLLDLRNRTDGRVIEPEQAILEIEANQRYIAQHRKAVDRKDLTTVYGGLTSVPYAFLTGVYFDDEGRIETYDWDRTREAWRLLDNEDDHGTFDLSGLEKVNGGREVVVALGFSYAIENADLDTTFSYQTVRLTLDGMSSDAHWSSEKQNRLAQQFLEVVKKLSVRGVRRIHLVMAAPNSVVFTFGRRYDKRNLPEIVVYQYERGQSPAYPWGVLMPVCGVDKPSIIFNRGAKLSL